MEDRVVDQVLSNVAGNFCQKTDEAIRLLLILRCIPQSEAECCPKLLSDLKTGSNDERYVASQLCRLWALEKTCQKHTSKGGQANTVLQQSLRDVLKSCEKQTLDLVKYLGKESSQSIRDRLLDFSLKDKSNDVDANDLTLNELIKYLQHFKEAGSERISMSVKEKEKKSSQAYKLIERCRRLREEKAVIAETIKEKSESLRKEKNLLDEEFLCRKEGYEIAKEKDLIEQKNREKELKRVTNERDEEHNKIICSLRAELLELEENHIFLQENNDITFNESNKIRSDLESKIFLCTLENESLQCKTEEEISSVQNSYREELKRREELVKHFELMDRNKQIAAEEEAVLKKVGAIEDEADKILFNGATQLQRLFRGLRGRASLRKKKKGKKGGKGKSKSKKKKK